MRDAHARGRTRRRRRARSPGGAALSQAARERSFKRVAGIDRSGGPPPQVAADQPWRPWTLPNLIGFIRALLIPAFLVLAMNSDDGRDTTANVLLFIAGASDYLDGLVARLTGQFSRLGTLLDPLVDRMLIIATAIVILNFELLPTYLMLLVLSREALMMLLSIPVLAKGLQIRVNWIGRLAVWPLMFGGFLALCTDAWIAEALIWIGMVGSYAATFLYVRTMLPQLRSRSAKNLNQG